MKLLVCGGRDFSDWSAGFKYLDSFAVSKKITHVIHGDNGDRRKKRGVDVMAGEWAKSRGIQEVRCPANWDYFNLSAGPIRNRAMLPLLPDWVISFPGGKGTNDMVGAAREAGITITRVNLGDL